MVVGAAIIVASFAVLPDWWRHIVVALTAGALAAGALTAITNRVVGRAIGLVVTVGAFVATVLGGSWGRIVAVITVLVVVGFLIFRRGQRRKPDAVADDGTLRPFMSDDGEQLVAALEGIWQQERPLGASDGGRPVHTRGTWATGRFDARRDISAEFLIPLLDDRPLSAVARFSNFIGDGERDDRKRQVHGLAVRVSSANDSSIDMVLVDMPRFMASNTDDFLALVRSFHHHGLRRYLTIAFLFAVGRTTLPALWATRGSRPASYAQRTYHGLNTFWWGREAVPVRYRLVPEADRSGGRREDPRDAATSLDIDLRRRLADGVEFRVELVDGTGLPQARLTDAIRSWPRGLPSIHLGDLRLDAEGLNEDWRGATLFEPFHLPAGVDASDDEILLRAARRTLRRTFDDAPSVRSCDGSRCCRRVAGGHGGIDGPLDGARPRPHAGAVRP